ncbi:MAG: hypothetical protein IBX47_13475 [Desulfuromonadales bacterium]|nr:hypothetical protein [Desulfuromonadales bacterium]
MRDISGSLNDDRLSQTLDLESISHSQLSRRLRDLPPEAIQVLFQNVIQEYAKEVGFQTTQKALGRPYLIDASTVSLCLSQYRWANFRKSKAGIKLHLRLNFHNGKSLPDKAVVTPAEQADKSQIKALIVDGPNALNVFDRGY